MTGVQTCALPISKYLEILMAPVTSPFSAICSNADSRFFMTCSQIIAFAVVLIVLPPPYAVSLAATNKSLGVIPIALQSDTISFASSRLRLLIMSQSCCFVSPDISAIADCLNPRVLISRATKSLTSQIVTTSKTHILGTQLYYHPIYELSIPFYPKYL